MALLGSVRAVHAIAVEHPRPRFRQIAMPHLVGALGERDALHFAPAGIEQAQLDLVGVLSENSAKLTPSPSQVAPRGSGRPGHTAVMGPFMVFCC